MKATKKTRRKSYGHIMVERGIFEEATAHVRDQGCSMMRFASRALEALLEKESRKVVETK